MMKKHQNLLIFKENKNDIEILNWGLLFFTKEETTKLRIIGAIILCISVLKFDLKH